MQNFIQPITLSFNHVRLEPLNLTHETGLQTATQDGQIWQLIVTTAPKPEDVATYIQTALDTRVAFAVIDELQNKIVGTTSFYNINPQVPRVEIGYTWYAKSAWRSRINTTCKYLMMCHAFETLGCYVIGWETDILNERSQQAIERLGAQKDGVRRADRIRKDGTIRDTVMYSMLKTEWENDKKRLLEQKLFQS